MTLVPGFEIFGLSVKGCRNACSGRPLKDAKLYLLDELVKKTLNAQTCHELHQSQRNNGKSIKKVREHSAETVATGEIGLLE
jgi:hypothetical protein